MNARAGSMITKANNVATRGLKKELISLVSIPYFFPCSFKMICKNVTARLVHEMHLYFGHKCGIEAAIKILQTGFFSLENERDRRRILEDIVPE